ncbi:MAG TPA: hypothetical protein ENK39_05755 [Epsilonproteobacteria bacterium]|nr:hypothetical protein [Campylobacterota bacterium]
MSKENLLRISLFVSVLVFNPVVAETLKPIANVQTQQETRVSTSIAKVLHKRGLDEDAAKKISQEFVADDEELFASMIENLLNGCKDISKDELLTYLSNEALFRKSVNFESYDQLVAMTSKIKQKALDEVTLRELQMIAKENRQLLA